MKDGSKTREAVLAAIKKGTKTVRDIAQKVGVTDGTARKYIGELLGSDQISVMEGGAKVEGKKGRPADTYEVI